jgi:putative PIN family toxin of toxin-antitoxin system
MSAIKTVIDTSVMVSVAFPKEGLTKELRDLIADGAFVMVSSKPILSELYRVLHYPRIMKQFKATEEDIDEFIGMVIEKAALVEGDYDVRKIDEDHSDDMFLSCAVEGKADFIVSRDPHLRNLKQFQGIKIVDAKTFIDKIKKKD